MRDRRIPALYPDRGDAGDIDVTALISLVAFLVAVSILVVFHEFGHFSVARLLGVKVLRFSVGFGKPLLRWRPRPHGTEFVIAPLPFGGYVKMLDEREGEVPPAERPRAFNRQSIWKRAAILVAGPAFNILFALLVYWIVFMAGVPGVKPVVGSVAPGTPAARAGVTARATIERVNGTATPTWQAARLAMLDAVMLDKPVTLRLVARDGSVHKRTLYHARRENLTGPGELLPGLGLTVWRPPIAPVIGSVEAHSPAARAGLFAGDRVLAVEGREVKRWGGLVGVIQAHPGDRLQFKVKRGGEIRKVSAVLGAHTVHGKTRGFLGVTAKIPVDYAQELRASYRLGPLSALIEGAARTGMLTSMTGVMLYRMVSGEASLSNLAGPVGIAHAAGVSAQTGIVSYLLFLAVISISLGILNLLPIPILDGGQLLFLGIEAIRRRPLSERAQAIGQRLGLGLLAILIGFAVFNDLARLVQP